MLTLSLALALALAQPIARAQDAAAPAVDDVAPAEDGEAAESAAPADGAVAAETAPPAEGARAADTAPTDAAPEAAAPEAAAPEAAEPDTATTLGASSAATDEDAVAADLAAESAAATEETEAAEAEAAPREPSMFRGSLFSWQHGMTVNTLDPSAQLTYDPTYYWSFFLQPRLYIDRQNFLVLSQGLSVELTDANYTTTQREPLLSDTVLEWRHVEVVEGFVLIPSVRLAAPLSTWSQAAERIVNTGVGLTVVRVFPEAASFTVALTGAYRHWWAASNSVAVNQATCYRGQSSDQPCGAGGATTERDRLLSALTLTVMPLPGFTILTQYAFAWVYGHHIATTTIGDTTYTDDGNHWRNFQYWTLAVGYDVVPWLNVQLGYQSASFMTDLYNGDGTVRNPFYNPESELYLSATLAIDVFVDEVIVGTDDDVSPEQMQRRRQGLARARGVDTSF